MLGNLKFLQWCARLLVVEKRNFLFIKFYPNNYKRTKNRLKEIQTFFLNPISHLQCPLPCDDYCIIVSRPTRTCSTILYTTSPQWPSLEQTEELLYLHPLPHMQCLLFICLLQTYHIVPVYSIPIHNYTSFHTPLLLETCNIGYSYPDSGKHSSLVTYSFKDIIQAKHTRFIF